MSSFRTSFMLTLALMTLMLMPITVASQDWPVKRKVDLSSNFGEYRNNRFHAGLDIRTGGEIGTKIFSPVDGYVWRVKMSYYGYGKGLYLKGDDGCQYVFGHLDSFSRKIDGPVKQAQIAAKRYYLDIDFPKDSIKISAGEFIAVSGSTGTKGPHLHFEKRTPNNLPINPVTHGFRLKDSTPPVFSSIIFRMTDDHSLFDNAKRSLELDVSRTGKGLTYNTDTILYLDRPTGILTECYDQIRPGGMHLTPHKMSFYVDDSLQYQVTFDSLDFDVQRSVNFEYDYVKTVDGNKDVRRLYHIKGNRYTGSRALTSGGGVIGSQDQLSDGTHRGKIVAADHAGNSSELNFDFIWGQPEERLSFDSTVTVSSDTDASLPYSVVDDGLIVEINAAVGSVTGLQIELYRSDSLLGTEMARFIDLNHFAAFIPPRTEYSRIDSINCSLFSDSGQDVGLSVPVNIFLVGGADNGVIQVDDNFSLRLGDNNLFAPRFILVEADVPMPGLFRVVPEAFVCRSDFQVMASGSNLNNVDENQGICWYDSKEDEWVWLENEHSAGKVAADVGGGGIYSLRRDIVPPKIKQLSITNGLTYFNPQHEISFLVVDTLSGFADDRNISIELDGNWMIPEYDPNTKVCKTTPLEPMADGRHDLRIVATDQAGNATEHKIHFYVKKKKN